MNDMKRLVDYNFKHITEQREDIKRLVENNFKHINTITKTEMIDFINNNSQDLSDILCIPK